MMHCSFDALVASALLIGLVKVLRRPVARAFGARAAYALWALPALRFAMPSLPGWRALYVPVFHVGEKAATFGLTSPADAAVLATDPSVLPALPPPLLPVPGIDWPTLLMAAWLGGAALWFAWQLVGYQRFLGVAMRGASHLTRECGVDVYLTGAVDGPVATGIVRRRIFLPLDFMTRYDAEERRLALLHEGAHHDRRDILANLVALAVLALHWFNPLAHRAYRLFRADQELACDETVLAGIGAAQRHAYGSAVVKAATARMPGVACALGHRAEIKHRLRAMARPVPGTLRSRAGLGLAVAAIGAGLVLTAPGRAAPPIDETVLSAADMAEIRADAEEARREGDRARSEAQQARSDAARAAAEGRREAALGRLEAARGRAEGEAARAQVALVRTHVGPDYGARQIAETRRAMAATCARQGKPVSPDLDWERLALCGDTGAAIAARARAQVHAELAREGID